MRNSIRLFSALALAAAVAACSGEDVPSATGTVSLDLVGQAPSGNIYRLRNALIIVQGPFTTTFWSTEDDPDRTSLSEEVPTGFYSAFVEQGWRLEFLDPAGPATPVDAELVSHNPISFDVFEGERTRVALRFRVGDDEVNFETGYDIVIDVDEVSPPPRICADDDECAAGETCCLAGLVGSCVALAPGDSCPLPDLTISAESGSPFVTFRTFEPESCAIADGCVLAPGERRLLSFSSRVPNVGASDLLMGDPTTTPGFTFSECRGQFQFEDYALYEVVDGEGSVVASGRRNASCVRDAEPLPGTTSDARFHCEFQGISSGWSNVDSAGPDCQWVDITDVEPGDYQLRVTVNPEQALPEEDDSNNTALLPIHIPAPDDVTEPCQGFETGDSRDCGWEIAADHQSVTCTPDETVTVGCGGSTGGVCESDPVLRVCAGDEPCLAVNAIVSVDDTFGLCPEATFTCPAGGTYTVLVAAFSSGSSFVCEVAP